MMAPAQVVFSAAVEGLVDEAMLRRLVEHAGSGLGPVHGGNGKASLLQRLSGYNNAARFAPWIVLVDLDRDADCAPPFREQHLPQPALHMIFRVAVREAEAWLMSDRESLARYLSVAVARIPQRPEDEPDPKRRIVDIARNSRKRAIREDMVPRPGSGREVGPAYTSHMIEFAQTHWRIDIATQHSDSLRRCMDRIREQAEANQ